MVSNDDIQIGIKLTADALKELGRAAARHPDSQGRVYDLEGAITLLDQAKAEISDKGNTSDG